MNKYEIEGRTFRSLRSAAKHYDIDAEAVCYRLKSGWPTEQAFTQPTSYDPTKGFRGCYRVGGGEGEKYVNKERAKKCVENNWCTLLWLWNQPGCRTFSLTMQIEEMGRRGLWDSYTPTGKTRHAEKVVNFMKMKEGKGELSIRKYLTQHPELPYFIQYNGKRNHYMNIDRGSVEYEQAIMRLIDGGNTKDFVYNFLRKISAKWSLERCPSSREDKNHNAFSITLIELLMLWPLNDLCPICKSTKMLIGEKAGGKGRGMANPSAASLDRKANEREYESGNCGWMCYRCNARKGDLSLGEMDRIAAWTRSAKKSKKSVDTRINIC